VLELLLFELLVAAVVVAEPAANRNNAGHVPRHIKLANNKMKPNTTTSALVDWLSVVVPSPSDIVVLVVVVVVAVAVAVDTMRLAWRRSRRTKAFLSTLSCMLPPYFLFLINSKLTESCNLERFLLLILLAHFLLLQ
jgi:hypothetical protein